MNENKKEFSFTCAICKKTFKFEPPDFLILSRDPCVYVLITPRPIGEFVCRNCLYTIHFENTFFNYYIRKSEEVESEHKDD
jgi:hypothetical protein